MNDRAVENMRIVWIDYVKAFSIMSVMLYHTYITPEIQRLIYILCLPAFFFISGLFLDSNLTIADFFKKRTKRLLIPYIIWGVLSWLAWLLIGRNYGTDTTDQEVWWLPLVGIACGKVEWLVHNRPLWFLCCLVSLDWFYYIISKIPSQVLQWIVCLIIAAIGCMLGNREYSHIWSITPAMIMLPIYMVGANSKIYVTHKVMIVGPYKGGDYWHIFIGHWNSLLLKFKH